MAVRLLHQAKYNAHTESLFKKSNILPFNLLADYFKLQFVHRYVHKLLPASLNETWLTNAEQRRIHANTSGMGLRPPQNPEDLHIPISRLSSTEKFPLASFPKLWNSFNDISLKIQPNKISFNIGLKKHLISTLVDNFTCNRLLCPHCHLNPP
jgi:hypothetical protein